MTDGRIDVLVAEDSAVARLFLVHILETDPRFHVVGAVGDGQAAIDFVFAHQPDVVLMDANMPRRNGFEATRCIMETFPLPIVICSAEADTMAVDLTFRALEAGAVAFLGKPPGCDRSGFDVATSHLLDTVALMSEVRVVRRLPRSRTAAPMAPLVPGRDRAEIQLVGIGASTGGPPVLQTLLAALPGDFAAPILVVQHISRGFLAGMAEWLSQKSALTIHIATHGSHPLPGHVYLAPDDLHMGIALDGTIVLSSEPPENHLRPSVSFLFRSLARVCRANALGVLLTGMGKDGAEQLKAMRDQGAITIAQDRETSIVHGMPGEAIALGAAMHVLPADRIAQTLVELVHGRRRPMTLASVGVSSFGDALIDGSSSKSGHWTKDIS